MDLLGHVYQNLSSAKVEPAMATTTDPQKAQ